MMRRNTTNFAANIPSRKVIPSSWTHSGGAPVHGEENGSVATASSTPPDGEQNWRCDERQDIGDIGPKILADEVPAIGGHGIRILLRRKVLLVGRVVAQ